MSKQSPEPGSAPAPRRRYKRFPRSWLDRWCEWWKGLKGTPADIADAAALARELEAETDRLPEEAAARYYHLCGAVYAATHRGLLPAGDVLRELEAIAAELPIEQETGGKQTKSPLRYNRRASIRT